MVNEYGTDMLIGMTLVVLTASVSLGGCAPPYAAAASPPPALRTKVSSVKPPQLSTTRLPKPKKASRVKLPSLPERKPEAQLPLPPSNSPSASPPLPAAVGAFGTFYVVRDVAGHCGVVDYRPSASSGLKIIDRSGYGECKDVVEREALINSAEQGADDKLIAAQTKAETLGGVDKLKPEDIKGLGREQLRQLRGH